MVNIDKDTIRTDSWNNIYTYLQTTNPISTNNIYSALNSKLITAVGYPLVILYPPSASFESVTVTGQIIKNEVDMMIEIYHTSSQNCKAIADEVTSKLLAGRATFNGEGLKRLQIDSGDTDVWDDGKKTIHRITFNITFRHLENN